MCGCRASLGDQGSRQHRVDGEPSPQDALIPLGCPTDYSVNKRRTLDRNVGQARELLYSDQQTCVSRLSSWVLAIQFWACTSHATHESFNGIWVMRGLQIRETALERQSVFAL